MDYESYKKIIRDGERVNWHGIMVPVELINDRVIQQETMMVSGLSDLESDLSESKRGTPTWTKINKYIEIVKENIRRIPYTQNGLINDCYMVKYNRILKEIEGEKTVEPKPKKSKTRKKRETKNSKLIFGK